jgi:Flp pilus assembly protein TadG
MRAFLDQRPPGAFIADKRGTVTIFGAALIAVLVGIVSLVAEFGLTLNRQNEDQRIADAAAFAAASYYGAHTTDSDVLSKSTAIAKSVGSLNGVPASGVTLNQVTSPRDSTKQALQVTITTTPTLFLSEILNKSRTTLTASANSYAEPGSPGTPAVPAVPGTVTGCIIALSASNGVTLSGGTSISAPTCGVATNATVTVPCGTKITASGIGYNTSAPSQGCGGITTTPTANNIVKAPVTDPLANSAGVVAAEAHVATVASLTAPSAPSVVAASGTGGTSVSLNLQYYPTTAQTSGGCTATFVSNTWTISCPAGATYNFTSLTVANSLSVTLKTTGSGTTNFNFPNAVSMSSGTWNLAAANYNFLNGLTIDSSTTTFQGAGNIHIDKGLTIQGGATALFQGAGTYYVAGGLKTSGSATVTFQGAGNYTFVNGLTQGSSNALTFQGAGAYAIGPNASCNSANYSICVTNSGVVNFSATDTFTISNGIYVSGGDTLKMGSGTSNSFSIGKASDGKALTIGGGAKVTLADATGSSSVFKIVGNVDVNSGGGSCTSFGAATDHDINGWFATAGGTMLGAGTYSINGYLAYGNNGGGSVTCTNPSTQVSASVGLQGTGVTIIYSAASTPSSGACNTMGLCFTAGFSNVYVSAPTTGTYAFLLFVGPQSGNSAGTLFSGGATANMTGAFYQPVGVFTMSGGASINSAAATRPDGVAFAGGCLQIVALSVSMSGGTTAASTCISGSSSQTGTAAVAAVPATPTKLAK